METGTEPLCLTNTSWDREHHEWMLHKTKISRMKIRSKPHCTKHGRYFLPIVVLVCILWLCSWGWCLIQFQFHEMFSVTCSIMLDSLSNTEAIEQFSFLSESNLTFCDWSSWQIRPTVSSVTPPQWQRKSFIPKKNKRVSFQKVINVYK